jgi:hypothetical protein
LGLLGRLRRWDLRECWDLDPTDLLLPSLSEVRSTTLRTISLGEVDEGLGGLSFSAVFEDLELGSCKAGLDRGRGEGGIIRGLIVS